jgi:multiple sugar transport system substrate-binding protein
VYDWKASAWRKTGDISYAPYLAFGGWVQVVPKNSQQKAAAFSLATHLGTQPVQTSLCVTPGTGVNPGRQSALDDIQAWEGAGFTKDDAENYLDTIRKSIDHPNAILDLRIPGQADYQDALELQLQRALAGRTSPEAALAEAAKAWEGITDKLDRERQKSLYEASLPS